MNKLSSKNMGNLLLGGILIILIIMVARINNPKNSTETKNIKNTKNEKIKSEQENLTKGSVWISSSKQNLKPGEEFDIKVMVNTGEVSVGAINLYLDFDSSKVSINKTQGIDINEDSGRGFIKGLDGENYTIMSNINDVEKGQLRLAGINVAEEKNNGDKHLITIKAKTLESFVAGETELKLRVNELSDILGKTIITENVTGQTITSKAK